MENDSFAQFLLNPTVLATIFIGGSALLLFYILKLFRTEHDEEERNQSEQMPSGPARKKETKPAPKKKPSARPNDKQKFNSPWLLKTLKNHTGQVLNMDYSSNGKYLASCAEEKRDPHALSECNKENREPDEPAPKQSPTTGLSRRQRKNRRRDDVSPDVKKKLKPVEEKPFTPLAEFSKLGMPEDMFVTLLYPHILTKEQMESMGYPMWAGRKAVYFNYFDYNRSKRAGFDVNAREFVPREILGDRSNSESSDDSSGSELDSRTPPKPKVAHEEGVQRTCVRCGEGFFVTDTEYLTQQTCFYHPGRLQKIPDKETRKPVTGYTCCGGLPDSAPCAACKLHVWNGAVGGRNYRSDGFVRTRVQHQKGGCARVYALDCEMCYTVAGLEVTKVSVVAMDGRLVYESFVRPPTSIVDYNTRYSGIKPEDLLPANSKTLEEVQNDLRGFIFADTILIGHGLENDLRALKMVHGCVVDTVCVFPHYRPPCKHSLRSLVANYLQRTVQGDPNGHDSYEDASACMELLLYKVGIECGGPPAK